MDLGALLESSPHAVLVVRPDGALVWGNATALRTLVSEGGVPAPGQSLLPLLAPRHRARAQQLLGMLAAGTRGGPVYLRLAGDEERWVAVRGAPADGGAAQIAVVDVTEGVLARRRLRTSERRFRAAFEVGVSGGALLDSDDRFVLVNPALARLLGETREGLLGRRPVEVVHPEDVSRLRQGTEASRAPLRLVTRAGEVRHVLVTTTRLDEEGRPLLFVQVEDVTERHTNERRLRHLALHDPLTDLPGRPLALSRLETALVRGTELTAVLFVDLDGFKLVNDALGHAAGDRLLVDVAWRLRDAVRPGDTVARFGGDEFLVVCPGLRDRDEGVAVAQRVERAVSGAFPYDEDEVLVSASVGVAFSDPDLDAGKGAEELVRDADTAMYRAKQLGKRRFEVFDHAMRERAAERLRIEHLLGRAVAEGRVLVHYQPVVHLVSREVVSLEALLRVRDDDGTVLAPASFLSVAQETGLLPQLDDVVLRDATAQVQAWREQTGRDLAVAVNVCAAQVNGELPAKVQAVLAGSGLPADRLVLELTEQALVSSASSAGVALQGLADSGVRLAIDDFGTGWASLTYLRRFPIAIVKVDRSFVAGLPGEADDCVIVKAVVDLAKQLDIACVAEGVEREEQYEALRDMASPFAQGFLFGRPLPPDEMTPALVAPR